MKVKLTQAVAFLVALGFAKAAKWDETKITERLAQVPEKVKEEDVPEGFEDFYKALVAAGGKAELEGAPAPAPEETPAEKPAKKEKKVKPAPEAAPAEKPAKKEKKEKPAPKPAKEVEKDAYGCRVGTISEKVNGVMTKEWMSEQEIAEAAGVTLDQARGRLYYAAEEGLFEHQRLVQYRLAAKKKEAKQ